MKRKKVFITIITILTIVSAIVIVAMNKRSNKTELATIKAQDENYASGSVGDTYKLITAGTVGNYTVHYIFPRRWSQTNYTMLNSNAGWCAYQGDNLTRMEGKNIKNY